MSEIFTSNAIYFQGNAKSLLSQYISERMIAGSEVFVLTDENTHAHCWPVLLDYCPELKNCHELSISSGERHKTIESCQAIWRSMLDSKADRNGLLLNLGGGMVCDVGGFVASVFKRGIDFIHIPTTLLGQVDASIGGKVGVNLSGAKNQLGLFSDPLAVMIFPEFLETLDKRQQQSGFAEMVKHALLSGTDFFEQMTNLGPAAMQDMEMIKKAISFKLDIVAEDRKEKNIRKILNFGHTFGHAFESNSFDEENPLLHGEAVACGMLCETIVSMNACNLSENLGQRIWDLLLAWFNCRPMAEARFDNIWELMQQDKKAKAANVLMVGLSDIGQPKTDVALSREEFLKTMYEYNKRLSS